MPWVGVWGSAARQPSMQGYHAAADFVQGPFQLGSMQDRRHWPGWRRSCSGTQRRSMHPRPSTHQVYRPCSSDSCTSILSVYALRQAGAAARDGLAELRERLGPPLTAPLALLARLLAATGACWWAGGARGAAADQRRRSDGDLSLARSPGRQRLGTVAALVQCLYSAGIVCSPEAARPGRNFKLHANWESASTAVHTLAADTHSHASSCGKYTRVRYADSLR